LERKYLLDPATYYRVRGTLAIEFTRDHFSRIATRHRYFVRSLYLDTADFSDYAEKLHGLPSRRKLRLRTYWKNQGEAAFVNVEEKIRSGECISKLTARVTPEQCERFLVTKSWGNTGDPVLERFEAVVRTEGRQPSALVDYYREVFTSRDAAGIRISFDHEIRFAYSKGLFPSSARFRSDLSGAIVMEIKTDRDDHPQVHRLVRAHGLKAVPNSKYANALPRTHHAVWYGNGDGF